MKKILSNRIIIFVLGVITGIFLLIIVAMIMSNNNGITLFDDEGDCVSCNNFQVMQVTDSGDALAMEIEPDAPVRFPTGITVLFLNDGKKSYYDEQLIRIPDGKCVKQIGVFKYMSNLGDERTVPVVGIRNK